MASSAVLTYEDRSLRMKGIPQSLGQPAVPSQSCANADLKGEFVSCWTVGRPLEGGTVGIKVQNWRRGAEKRAAEGPRRS